MVLNATVKQEYSKKVLTMLSWVTWIGVAVLIIMCLVYSLLVYNGFTENSVSLIPSILWILSFIFLADALRRIKVVMNQV